MGGADHGMDPAMSDTSDVSDETWMEGQDRADELVAEANRRECDVPPAGWSCTRARGHEGPCAAVPLPQIRPAEPVPDNGVVELLRDLLAQAERGEVLGVTGVAQHRAGEFSRFTSPSARRNAPLFLGYLRVLEMRLEKEIEIEEPEHYGR